MFKQTDGRKFFSSVMGSVAVRGGCVVLLTGFFAVTARASGLVSPQVVAGKAQFATSGSTTMITNTAGAIINWKQFSIAAGHEVNFKQESVASTVLNRVTGGNPSEIMGKLISNGRVFLINPAGIAFGEGSVINTAGLIASALNISNEDFEHGIYNFKAGTEESSVSNAGSIVVAPDGFAMMFGANVKNTGLIKAENGAVILAAGKSVEISSLTNPGLSFTVTAPEGSAENLGSIIASGGEAALRAAVVSNAGTVNTMATGQGGAILLEGTKSVSISGSVVGNQEDIRVTGNPGGTASITQTGGLISGNEITIAATAAIAGKALITQTGTATIKGYVIHVTVGNTTKATEAAFYADKGVLNSFQGPNGQYILVADHLHWIIPAHAKPYVVNTVIHVKGYAFEGRKVFEPSENTSGKEGTKPFLSKISPAKSSRISSVTASGHTFPASSDTPSLQIGALNSPARSASLFFKFPPAYFFSGVTTNLNEVEKVKEIKKGRSPNDIILVANGHALKEV